NFDPAAAVTGNSSNRIIGNVSFSGVVNVPNFELAAGWITGTFTNAGTLNWTSGNIGGNVTIASGGVLNISGAGDKRIEGGGATLNNAGVVTHQAGALL